MNPDSSYLKNSNLYRQAMYHFFQGNDFSFLRVGLVALLVKYCAKRKRFSEVHGHEVLLLKCHSICRLSPVFVHKLYNIREKMNKFFLLPGINFRFAAWELNALLK